MSIMSAPTLSAQTPPSHLVGDGVAVFYPQGFVAGHTLPSLALKTEPSKIGEIPSSWTLKPVFRQTNGKQIAEFYAGRNVSLYGTGEVTGPLLRNGRETVLWNTDNFNYKTDSLRLYQSHPWVMGVRPDGTAFGIMADHTYKQRIVCRDTIRFESDGPAFRMFVIEKSTPSELIKALGQLTGNMPLPPLWALGYQQCRWSYASDARVREIANEFRSRQIPCDVIWMDIDYMDGFRVFTFDSVRFPDPKRLNNFLHKKDFKSVWMIDPGVKADTAYHIYKSGTQGKHWVTDSLGNPYEGNVWPGSCRFPDFTRPETQEWWAALYHDYMATGIDGVWNDMNEPAVFDTPGLTMPAGNHHRGGDSLPEGLHARYHNLYGLLMVRSSRQGILAVNPDKRPFILSRSNFLGGQRYAATWTGDNASTWEHLKLSVPMSLTLGLSGQPFNGPDIGGFSENPSPELFGHWMALGAFYPFSRGHAMQGTVDKEPWAFGPEIEQVARVAITRRYLLMPYLYTCFHEASQTNMPVMRPVFFADAKDLSLRAEEQAFLLGNDLLVVPQWAKDPALPKGFNRFVSLLGEQADDKYQPRLFQRNGSIIVIGKPIQSTTHYDIDSLQLFISLNDQGTALGQLYVDEGDGFGYEKDDFALIQFEARLVRSRLKLAITQLKGDRTLTSLKVKIIENAEYPSPKGGRWQKVKVKKASY
ncbi:MAG: glycoside hydrolase family 31 protein [Breznakibacter sp.]